MEKDERDAELLALDEQHQAEIEQVLLIRKELDMKLKDREVELQSALVSFALCMIFWRVFHNALHSVQPNVKDFAEKGFTKGFYMEAYTVTWVLYYCKIGKKEET